MKMAGNPEIKDCVTMAQFNELKRSMEEKQDQLSQDLQELMAQLRNLSNIPEAASNYDETDEKIAARLARQQQQPSSCSC
jgi:outer membrane murein-binding lipoprotein Lpp